MRDTYYTCNSPKNNTIMRIWVKGFQRSRFALDVTDLSVAALKTKIAEQSGVPVQEQHIVFRGELLKDSGVLSGVQENDQITLLKKINDNTLPKPQPPPVSPVATGVLPNGAPAQPLPPDLQNMVNNLMNNFMRIQPQNQQNPQNPQNTQNLHIPQPTQTPQPAQPQLPQFLFPQPVQQQQQQQPVPQRSPPTHASPTTTQGSPTRITPSSLPQIPKDSMDQMVLMGFSELRARKALYFNQLNVERSVDWLFEHMDDADIDAPLTRDQILQLVRLYNPPAAPSPHASPQPSPQTQHIPSPTATLTTTPTPTPTSDPAAEERQKKQKAIQEAISNNVCTFTATGSQFASQEFYQCFTCNLAGNQGCCAVCARVCHAGHNVSAPTTTTFFCDCGAGDSGKPCNALTKKP